MYKYLACLTCLITQISFAGTIEFDHTQFLNPKIVDKQLITEFQNYDFNFDNHLSSFELTFAKIENKIKFYETTINSFSVPDSSFWSSKDNSLPFIENLIKKNFLKSYHFSDKNKDGFLDEESLYREYFENETEFINSSHFQRFEDLDNFYRILISRYESTYDLESTNESNPNFNIYDNYDYLTYFLNESVSKLEINFQDFLEMAPSFIRKPIISYLLREQIRFHENLNIKHLKDFISSFKNLVLNDSGDGTNYFSKIDERTNATSIADLLNTKSKKNFHYSVPNAFDVNPHPLTILNNKYGLTTKIYEQVRGYVLHLKEELYLLNKNQLNPAEDHRLSSRFSLFQKSDYCFIRQKNSVNPLVLNFKECGTENFNPKILIVKPSLENDEDNFYYLSLNTLYVGESKIYAKNSDDGSFHLFKETILDPEKKYYLFPKETKKVILMQLFDRNGSKIYTDVVF